jgi:hypothetical protein
MWADDQIDGPGADQGVDDLEGLLAVVGLRHQQVVELDAQAARVLDVEGVLGVDERAHPAGPLGLGDRVERERGLARRLRAVDLDDAPARQAAAAQGDVEGDRAGRDDLDLLGLAAVEPHERPRAELLVDDLDRLGDRLLLLVRSRHAYLRRPNARSI